MVCLKKKLVLTLTILLIVLSALLLVEPCVAPITVPENPSAAPEIVSVEIYNEPIWVPPTYSTPNPYTGEVTQTHAGYYVRSGNIVITIKNRPFTPYTDENGKNIKVYYCLFRESLWTGAWEKSPTTVEYQETDSDYTSIIIHYQSGGGYGIFIPREFSTVVFRIQAITGYYIPAQKFGESSDWWLYPEPVYEGEGSKWTEFTITMPPLDEPGVLKPNIQYPSNSPVTSNLNNLFSQKPWLYYLIVILATTCIITVPIVIVLYHNKYQQHKRKPKSHSNISSNAQFTETCKVQR